LRITAWNNFLGQEGTANKKQETTKENLKECKI
jgi:hypothetical protein